MSVSVEIPKVSETNVKAWPGYYSGYYVEIAGETFFMAEEESPVLAYCPGSMGMDKSRPLPRGTKIILTVD